MENVPPPGRILSRKAPIQTLEFESQIIEELQQERLRQSRIIARQLDTIGKLKQALDQLISERSSRRSSVCHSQVQPLGFFPPETDQCDAETQTYGSATATSDHEDDIDEIRTALTRVNAENQRLQSRTNIADYALRAEKAKTQRILNVCTRISSAPESGISSPALAKWVALGLEDGVFSDRQRTETFDDTAALRLAWLPAKSLDSSLFTRSRSALSEGDSPVAGLDLDMIYGSFDAPSSVPRDAVPMTPKAGDENSDPDFLRQAAGSYWTGSHVAVLRVNPSKTYMLIGDWSDGQPIAVAGHPPRALTAVFQSNGRRIDGSIDKNRRSIRWESGDIWERIDYAHHLCGTWWTGFCTIHLNPTDDMSGTVAGSWGLRTVELRALAPILDGEGSVMGSLGEAIDMYGSIEAASKAGLSVIRWGNGQRWEQVPPPSSPRRSA